MLGKAGNQNSFFIMIYPREQKRRIPMKKLISLTLVLCLLLAVCPMAMAISATPEYTLNGDYHLFRTVDMLYTVGSHGEVLCTMDGKALTNYNHGSMWMNDCGNCFKISDRETSLTGLLALDGTEIAPIEFDSVTVTDEWAVGYHYAPGTDDDWDVKLFTGDKLIPMVIDTATVFSIASGKQTAVLNRSEMLQWDARYGYINIEDRSGVIHTYDSSFKEVSTAADYYYSFAPVHTEYTTWMDDDTYLEGLADTEGRQLSEAIYDYVSIVAGQNDWFQIYSEDDLLGLLDSNGEEVVPLMFTELLTADCRDGSSVFTTCGIFAGYTDDETVTMFDARTGAEASVDVSGYDYVRFLGTCLVAEQGDNYTYFGADGKQLDLDYNNEWMEEYVLSCGTFIVCSDLDDGNGEEFACLMDDHGNILLTAEYIYDFSMSGYVIAYNDGVCDIYNLAK